MARWRNIPEILVEGVRVTQKKTSTSKALKAVGGEVTITSQTGGGVSQTTLLMRGSNGSERKNQLVANNQGSPPA